MKKMLQANFDLLIGQLDRAISLLVYMGKVFKEEQGDRYSITPEGIFELVDIPNRSTVKHHAEDMILAGRKILKDLGEPEPGIEQHVLLDVTDLTRCPTCSTTVQRQVYGCPDHWHCTCGVHGIGKPAYDDGCPLHGVK